MSDSEIPLAEVIQQLRQELQTAIETAEGQGLRFEVQDLELEVQVLVTKGGSVKMGGGGEVKFWVLGAKGEGEMAGKYESSRLQKVKLKLLPKTGEGGNVRLRARRPGV